LVSSFPEITLEEWLAELPEGSVLVDPWEQPIPRPEDSVVQEHYFSGKKKITPERIN
jgi:hypothetical protein